LPIGRHFFCPNDRIRPVRREWIRCAGDFLPLHTAKRSIQITLRNNVSFALGFVENKYFRIRLLVRLATADLTRGAAEPDLSLQLENFRNATVLQPRAGLLHEAGIARRSSAQRRITGKADFHTSLVASFILGAHLLAAHIRRRCGEDWRVWRQQRTAGFSRGVGKASGGCGENRSIFEGRECGGPDSVAAENALLPRLAQVLPYLIGAVERRARALHKRQVGGWIYVARFPARGGHASGIKSRAHTRCLRNRDLPFEMEAEGRDQVGAGNQFVVIDGVAHRSRVGATRKTVAAVLPARFYGVEIHVKVQDGIDVDEVWPSTGNLVTRAVCEPLTIQLARRHGSFGSGVVAKRDGCALTFEEILRSHEYVGPRWTERCRRECVESEVFVSGKFAKIRIGTVTAADNRQQAEHAE
jgi:hypothetical protein